MASGRSRNNVPAPVYKDFQPKVERQEEQDANILLIHLPGFPKELIGITYVDSSRTIKVQAERALEKNTRSRFSQAFSVPENCIVENIQGTFRNGVLTIRMPKNIVTEVASVKDVGIFEETSPPTKSIEDKDQKETSPKAASTSGVEKPRDEKLQSPRQTHQKPISEPKAPMATAPQTASPKAKYNGKKVEALEPLQQQEETQKKVSPISATTTKQIEEKTAAGSSSTAEIVEEKAESKDGLKDQVKEKDSMLEAQIPKISKGKKGDKADVGAVEEKPKAGVGSSSFLERAKEMKGMDTIMKTMKRLATEDYEDRQSLLNIGVSVLVIVALGAYIAYSYRSSGKAKN